MSYKPLFIGTALFFVIGALIIIFFFGCASGTCLNTLNAGQTVMEENYQVKPDKQAAGPDCETLVVYNSRSEHSFKEAQRYLEDHNIRMINLCAVDVPQEKEISWGECEELVFRNINDSLMMLSDGQITKIVFSYDIPEIINPRPAHIESSLDNHISGGFLENHRIKKIMGFSLKSYSVNRIEDQKYPLLSYSFSE